MFDFRRYIRFPEVDLESSRSPAKCESWNKSKRQRWAVFPTRQNFRWSCVWWMYAIKRAERPPQTLVHFVTALASLFTDQRTSNLPIRAAYKHCGDNLRAYFWQVSNWFQFLLCEVMVVQARSWDSVQRLCPFYLSIHDFNALFRMTFHIVWPRDSFCVRFLPPW